MSAITRSSPYAPATICSIRKFREIPVNIIEDLIKNARYECAIQIAHASGNSRLILDVKTRIAASKYGEGFLDSIDDERTFHKSIVQFYDAPLNHYLDVVQGELKPVKDVSLDRKKYNTIFDRARATTDRIAHRQFSPSTFYYEYSQKQKTVCRLRLIEYNINILLVRTMRKYDCSQCDRYYSDLVIYKEIKNPIILLGSNLGATVFMDIREEGRYNIIIRMLQSEVSLYVKFGSIRFPVLEKVNLIHFLAARVICELIYMINSLQNVTFHCANWQNILYAAGLIPISETLEENYRIASLFGEAFFIKLMLPGESKDIKFVKSELNVPELILRRSMILSDPILRITDPEILKII